MGQCYFDTKALTRYDLQWANAQTVGRPEIFFKTIENKLLLGATNQTCLRLAELNQSVSDPGIGSSKNDPTDEAWVCVEKLLTLPVEFMGPSQLEQHLNAVIFARASEWGIERAAALRTYLLEKLQQLYTNIIMWQTTKPYDEICNNAVAVYFGQYKHKHAEPR